MFDTAANDLGDRLQGLIDDLDPDCFDGPGAVRMLDAFTRLENLAAYGKTVMARRVEYTRAWKREGDATPAHFVARRTGTTVTQAVSTLKTARQTRDLGAVDDAAKAGELSAQQANEITDACTADPHAEKRLVEAATRDSLQELRDECRRVKAAARDDELAQHDAIRRSRFLHTWTDREGAGRGEWKLPPEDHARVVARVTAELKSVVVDAKAAGTPPEPAEAHAADALVRVVEASAGTGGTEVVMHLRVDHAAFERGRTEAGEICEIEGVSPVPVATARNLSTRAVVNALVTNGTDVSLYANLGRFIPTSLELALEARDPVCVALGCSVRDKLEIHHIQAVDDDGPTSLENCCRLCRWHHYLCTHQGWQVEGTPGDWKFSAPSGRSPPDHLKLAV